MRFTNKMERVKECTERFWERIKQNSGMLMIVGSMLLFLFGCFFLIAGAYIGATFTTQIEQGAVIAACVSGGLLILFSFLGAAAYKKGHGVLTYLLFFIAFGLFVGGLVIVGIALTYLNRIRDISGLPPPFPFSQNITSPELQEVSDYINSIYTTCCTGCSVAVCGRFLNETTFCPNQLSSPNPQCANVVKCPDTQSNIPNCYFGRGPDDTIPPYDIGQGICNFLKSAAWGEFNTPVVGNLGTDPKKVSCGGGDPKVFAFSVRDWLFSQYAWISAIIGIILFVLCLIMVAAVAYDRNERENAKPKKTHDAMRPFS